MISGKTVKYLGKTIQLNGNDFIVKNQNYEEVVVALAEKIVSVCEEEFSVVKLFGDCPLETPTLQRNETIRFLIDKLADLASSSIIYDGDLYAVDLGHTPQAIPLMGKNLPWSLDASGANSVFTYSFDESLAELPDGYVLNSANVRVIGKEKGGNTVVRRTSDTSGTISIPFDRYPAFVELESRVSTKTGDMELRTVVPLQAPTSTSGNPILEVKDFSSKSRQRGGYSVTQVIEFILSTVFGLRNYIDSLRSFNGIGIMRSVAQAQLASTNAQSSSDALNTVSFNSINGCDINKEGSIQDAVDALGGNNTALGDTVNNTNDAVSKLDLRIASLENPSGVDSSAVSV